MRDQPPENIWKLFSLYLILSPLSVSADQHDSKPWIGTLIITLSLLLLLLITAAVAAYIRRYSNGIFGAATANGHREEPPAPAQTSVSIESLPSLRYSEIKMHRREVTCAVCLNEFQDSDVLRVLPECCHVFHPDCIAPWLASHVTCPVCRVSLEHRQGSGVGISSVLERLSSGVSLPEGSDHQDQDVDDHRTAEMEEGSSSI